MLRYCDAMMQFRDHSIAVSQYQIINFDSQTKSKI